MGAYIGQPVKFPSYLRQVPHINDNFILRRAVGKGTFGVVFLGVLKGVESERYAFKFLVPTSCLTSYQSEIKVLQALGQHEHVISLLSSVRHLDQVVFVFPYFEHNTFPNIIKSASEIDIGYYMLSLLGGINYIHSQEVIHRDIKPSNFLYNMQKRTGKLIDFGVSKFWSKDDVFKYPMSRSRAAGIPCSHNSSSVCDVCLFRKVKQVPRAGTAGYRAPEVLLGSCEQTSAIDIWSAGVILLSLLSGYYPFFKPKSDISALAELISVFGTTSC